MSKREQPVTLPSLEEPEDNEAAFINHFALREGWFVADNDLYGVRIERHDVDEVFASDGEAREHVERLAAEGSALHQSALDMVGGYGEDDCSRCGRASDELYGDEALCAACFGPDSPVSE